MKRGYTALEYKSIIRRLRSARPEICIASDFIIGFPGETDADFESTMKLVDDIGFDGSFSFMYSPRPGTPAASLPDQVPLHVKKERLARLQGKLNELAGSVSHNMVGTVQTVLVEGSSKKDAAELAGRTSNNRVVNFGGPSRLHGQMIDVRITEALPHSLRGEVLIEETA
jgi:tRNA-2-methylthio-N6-dimethylallyladenosine synthase